MARILVIDDNPDMLNMLDMILSKRAHHQTILCADGPEGLEAALANPPDLAIVDVMMPGMSGYEVVRKLRSDPRTENVRIIVLTARGQPVDREAATRAGADAFIAKPVEVRTLLAQVEDLLTQQQGVSSAAPIWLPVFSLRGGVGVTTVAVNLAMLLQTGAPTILVDLSPNSGHCVLFLGLKPRRHWGHYLENPDASLDTILLPHSSGLRLLAAPPVPLSHGWFEEDDIVRLIEQLSTMARFIVVDGPPVLNQAMERIIERAHHILLITGDDAASLQTTLTTLQTLEADKKRIAIVRNMYAPGPHPSLDALRRAIPVPLIADLPFEAAQRTAMHKGVPLVAMQPQGGMATALKRAVRALLTKE